MPIINGGGRGERCGYCLCLSMSPSLGRGLIHLWPCLSLSSCNWGRTDVSGFPKKGMESAIGFPLCMCRVGSKTHGHPLCLHAKATEQAAKAKSYLWRPIFVSLSAEGPLEFLPQWSQCDFCHLIVCVFCPVGR